MKKIKFITLSDPHWNDWSNNFNEVDRLISVRDTMVKIYQHAHQHNAAILLPGDLAHNPEHISNRTLQELLLFYKLWEHVPTYAIDGNHDQEEMNTPTNRSPNWVSTLGIVIPKFHNVADSFCNHEGVVIRGIPYLTGNKGFKEELKKLESEIKPNKKKILLIHTDLPRAKDSSGYQIDTVNNIPANYNKLFKAWDLVLCGHIHMGQQMTSKVLMVGAPYQQRRSDQNLVPGFWEIYDDFSYKFIKLNIAPVYKSGDVNDKYDFYTKPAKKMNKTTETEELNFKKGTNTDDLVKNYMQVIKETNKKKMKLLKEVLR